MKNQKASARHSVENKGSVRNAKPIDNRIGTSRINPDPFLDGEAGDLHKGRMTKDIASHILGYRIGNAQVKSKHGPEHLGDMPQLGEGPYKGHRQTVIPLRHLK